MLNPHVRDSATPQHVHVLVGRNFSPVHVVRCCILSPLPRQACVQVVNPVYAQIDQEVFFASKRKVDIQIDLSGGRQMLNITVPQRHGQLFVVSQFVAESTPAISPELRRFRAAQVEVEGVCLVEERGRFQGVSCQRASSRSFWDVQRISQRFFDQVRDANVLFEQVGPWVSGEHKQLLQSLTLSLRWVVVKIYAFWIPITIRHLIFRVPMGTPKRDHDFDNRPGVNRVRSFARSASPGRSSPNSRVATWTARMPVRSLPIR